MNNKTISITLTKEQARAVIRLIDQRAAERASELGYADRDDAIDELGYQLTGSAYAYFPDSSIQPQLCSQPGIIDDTKYADYLMAQATEGLIKNLNQRV